MNNETQSLMGWTGQQEFLTKSQVAQMFGATERTIESYMAKGIIPFFRLGRTVRFHREDIHRHLAENFKCVGMRHIGRVVREGKSVRGGYQSSRCT